MVLLIQRILIYNILWSYSLNYWNLNYYLIKQFKNLYKNSKFDSLEIE